MDPGGAAPTLRGIRALPQPEASIWPQVLFDMRYQGEAAGSSGVGGRRGGQLAVKCALQHQQSVDPSAPRRAAPPAQHAPPPVRQRPQAACYPPLTLQLVPGCASSLAMQALSP